MTPPELLLQAVRLLEFSKAETFPDFVHEELRLLSVRLIESALEQLEPDEPPLPQPPQIQRVRGPSLEQVDEPLRNGNAWPSALSDGSVSTGRNPSAYNSYMSEAIAMVHALFPNQSHRANFMMAASVWKKIKDDTKSTKDLVKAARDILLRDETILREVLIEPTQRTVGLSV